MLDIFPTIFSTIHTHIRIHIRPGAELSFNIIVFSNLSRIICPRATLFNPICAANSSISKCFEATRAATIFECLCVLCYKYANSRVNKHVFSGSESGSKNRLFQRAPIKKSAVSVTPGRQICRFSVLVSENLLYQISGSSGGVDQTTSPPGH